MDFGPLMRGERNFTVRDIVVLFAVLIVGTGVQVIMLLLAILTPALEIKLASLAIYSLVIFGMAKLFLPMLLHR